jgi:glycerophosphoryl diester phosphodiesterase
MTFRAIIAPAAVLLLLLPACRTEEPMPTPGAAGRTMSPAGQDGQLINIAHRGASGHAPENTLPAFDLSLDMRADYFELDVYLTRDGVPVVLHDSTLERTTRGPTESCTGEVGDKTLAQIRSCEAGSWFNAEFPAAARPEYASGVAIPTLEEVFQRFGRRANYLIEIKQPQKVPGVEEKVLELYERYGLREPAEEGWQVVTQSFSEESMRKMHALAPELPLIQLLYSRETSESIRGMLDRIRDYAIGIGPYKNTVDAAVVQAVHERCLQIFPYTVNEPQEMTALLALGVDGIISNFPDRLNDVLGEQRERKAHPGCPARRGSAALGER